MGQLPTVSVVIMYGKHELIKIFLKTKNKNENYSVSKLYHFWT